MMVALADSIQQVMAGSRALNDVRWRAEAWLWRMFGIFVSIFLVVKLERPFDSSQTSCEVIELAGFTR